MLDNVTRTAMRPKVARGFDGKILTLADLWKPGQRWVRSRKLDVLGAIHGGLITADEARERFRISEAELNGWRRLYLKEGAVETMSKPDVPHNGGTTGHRRARRHSVLTTMEGETLNGLRIEPSTRTVAFQGKSIRLCGMEFMILLWLVRYAGEVVDKKCLFDHVWPPTGSRPESKILDVGISKIRKKMREEFGVSLIETSWGRGYKLSVPTEQ